MQSVRNLVIDPARPTPTSEASLASWYTEGITDGFGDRLLMFDNTSSVSLELLRFRPELARAPGFEPALRESVERVAPFEHPLFSHVKAVECLEGDNGLTLVSTYVAGKRLSQMFQGRPKRGGVHPAFIAWLIRQLAPALVEFHARAGMAHGTLTADRIVLTSGGGLVITESVLGAALDELRLPANRLWADYGIFVPPIEHDIPRLDGRTDIFQLGSVALSLLLGRRITFEEHLHQLDSLLDEFVATAGGRGASVLPVLRAWLARALLLGGAGFESALEAQENLQEFSGPVAASSEFQLPRRLEMTAPEQKADEMLALASEPVLPARHVAGETAVSQGAVVLDYARPELTVSSQAMASDEAAGDTDDSTGTPGRAHWTARFLTARNLAVAFGCLALVELAFIGSLLSARTSAPAAAAAVPVRIESQTPGDLVMVDGRQVGVTPVELTVGSSQAISVVRREAESAAAAAPPPVPTTVDVTPEQDAAAAAIALAEARQRSGGLRLVSPIELQVLEGERVLGSSADGPIVTTAGRHQLDFVNNALGYRARQTVEIRRGQIVSLTIQPPDGRLSINAVPWAQVSIDGAPVGETPLANLPVPVGQHEITFRHPQLGERRQTLIVKSGVDTRVSVAFDR
jgi:hypothetical protein